MHSSYALASSEFSVERDGASSPLADLWPGYRPDDRLGVVLANPMDACGCSNLICGTNTLFYDDLRAARGVGNFFRYADTFLFGVGCEPGDFNQLDVWPLHKFVTVLQPTAEALIEMLNDRRITLLAIPDTGARCRGEVVLSTWNTYLETVRCVVTYSPRTGKARDADVTLVGNRVVESYVEQAIFTTPGIGAGEQARLRRLRRNLDREPMQCVESYRSLPNAAAARALLGVTQVLPPGHQELTRRSQPTTIVPVEQPLPPFDSGAAPFDRRGDGSGAAGTVVGRAPAHGLRRDPAPPGRHLRRVGGLGVDLRLRRSRSPSTTRCARRSASGTSRRSRSGCSSGPDALAAADYCFANNMASLEVGQCRYGPFVDEWGKMIGDGVVFNAGEHMDGLLVVTALPSDADHFRRVTAGKFDVEIVEDTLRQPHVQVQGPRSRELIASLTDADVAGLRYFRFIPEPITIGGVPNCILARTGYSGELGYEIYVQPRARRAAVAGAARPGRVDGHQAVRPRRGRVAAHRVGPDLHRLRLLPGRDVAVPHEPRPHDQPRDRRLRRQGRRCRPSSKRASPTA